MPRIPDIDGATLPLEVARQIDAVCDEFEAALKFGAGCSLDNFISRVDPRWRERLLEELTLIALDQLRRAGVPDPGREILSANPTLHNALARIVAEVDVAATTTARSSRQSSSKSSGLVVRCPHCRNTIDLIVDASLMEIECTHCGGTFSLVNDAEDTRDAAVLTKVAHFELIERLGMGGFGTVWKARDTLLERTVALKIPRREQLDPLSIEKFMREARAAAQLRHPNIVSTHEIGRDGDTLYIVNDYIRAVPLSEMASDHRLDIHDSVSMLTKVADALDHAHTAGVIHRDLKPSNILVDDNGEPHLTDFGLAKRREHEITMTTEGAVMGTPAYMPPEQARGEGHSADGRSDIYSLGVILFQLLTGDLPFRGSTQMMLQKVINDDPPGPRTLDGRVPKDLDTICLKCLEKEPSRRYATAGELAADLRRYLAGQPVLARRLGTFGRTLRWSRRNRAVSLLLAATMVTLLTAAIVSSYFGWRAAENAVRADQVAQASTDNLYDSLQQEIKLTREVRGQGYGIRIRQLIGRARDLRTTRIDNDELRRQLVLTMGDIAAYAPFVITPPAETTSIRLNSNGQEVMVGLTNGRLLIYDTRTGKQRSELEAFDGPVQSIAINSSDDQLVAADRTGTACEWRNVDQKWRLERTIHLGSDAYSVVVAPHGEVIAWLNGPVLELWDVATGTKLRSLPTEPDWSLRNAAFDIPNRRLVGGYVKAKTDQVGWALWHLDTGKRSPPVEMATLGGTYANDIDVSNDGARLAIGFDEALQLYELNSFQRTNLYGFDATMAVAFNPTNPYLAVANIRGSVTLWNSVTERQLVTLPHPRPRASRDALAFSGDGTHLAHSNADTVQVWDFTKVSEKTVMTGHKGGIPCAAFDPNGRVLATGGKDNEVRFWNPSTGQLIGCYSRGEPVQTLAFSADGRWLAIGSTAKTDAPHLRVIDAISHEIVYEAKPTMGEVNSLAWAEAPGGRYLAGCGEHGVALWKVSHDRPLSVEEIFALDRNRCLATLLSRDAEVMVWVQDDTRLQAWDVASGRQKPLHAPPMWRGWHSMAFLPDGRSIIYVSKAGVAEVWDVQDDHRVDSFGQPGTFNSNTIALSPDGRWFAGLTQPDTVSVWHLPTQRHVLSLRPETGSVWSLAWDPASEQLAVGQSDGGLAVWHLPRIQQKLAESSLAWQED